MEKTSDKVQILPATEADIQDVLTNIRPRDLEELTLFGLTPEGALRVAVRGSVGCWLGKVNGETVCLFGLQKGSFMNPDLRPWMVGTLALERHPLTFLRHSREALEKILQIFPNLTHYVHEDNLRSVRWLRWLGFSIGPPKTVGDGRGRFHTVERRRE